MGIQIQGKLGGYQHLAAILDLLKQCNHFTYGYVHIISGEDYPLINVAEIERRLEKDNRIYCDYCLITQKSHPLNRRYRYYWPYVKFSMNYKNRLVRLINLFCVGCQSVIPACNRKSIGNIDQVYAGFVWGSYPKDSVEYVLRYLEQNTEYWRDLQSCKIPEEIFFQSILMNSSYKNRMTGKHLRWFKFEGGDGSGPVYIENIDLEQVFDSEAIFARKIRYDSDVRRILEQRII